MEFSISIILQYLMAIGVGLGCGSFATMPYYRLPNKIPCAGKWIGEKSACTKCGHQLRTRDLVPVFNWLLTRGKCQFCGYKISPVYFFIEFSVATLSVLTYMKFGLEGTHLYIMVLGLATCMVILTATEHTYRKIPDNVLIVAVMLAFLYNTPQNFNDMILVFVHACLVGVIYASCYEKIKHKPLPDFGHPKLLAVAGFWLPYGQLFIHLSLVVVLCIIIVLICRVIKSKRTLPFGFALTSSLMLNVLYPNWYDLIF